MHVEKWPTNHRKNGISVSTKMIIFVDGSWLSQGVTHFAGKTSWRYTLMYVEACTVSKLTRNSTAQQMPVELLLLFEGTNHVSLFGKLETWIKLLQISMLSCWLERRRAIIKRPMSNASFHDKTHHTLI
jgi:hypothetical protein